ncbi:NADH-quinone oxidoreductase subunit C [Streptomyces aidingensis]|uniref:NADH-quinone oxidoreductase subunit C n=1 Tax=Streptomyces aidingensis TaxID=910347 RepID=A0A1I1E4E4_9ACTN|nr:NADH-quinone oxidoreductase subunit C [Streptomyces aidingensis]
MSWLDRDADQIFGEGATAHESYSVLTVDVPAQRWHRAALTARDELGCTYFDWLSAVDEQDAGFLVCLHVAALGGTAGTAPRRLLLRTALPRDAAELPTLTDVYPGANWHERETHEMFGLRFAGHPSPGKLLLPESFEGHPLRKDFVLAARVAKAWPGAKEPGEPAHGGPRRRQMLPPGVPDPNEWGPLKGKLPAAPERPERPGRPGRPAASGEAPARRPRRTRSASEGSASRRRPPAPPGEGEPAERDSARGAVRSGDAPWLRPADGERPEGRDREEGED